LTRRWSSPAESPLCVGAEALDWKSGLKPARAKSTGPAKMKVPGYQRNLNSSQRVTGGIGRQRGERSVEETEILTRGGAGPEEELRGVGSCSPPAARSLSPLSLSL
jgi:hypothetical protein